MNKDQLRLTFRDRKIVIVTQLGVLIFILAGLFGPKLFDNGSTMNAPAIDLEGVAVNEQVSNLSTIQDVTVRARAAYAYDVQGQKVLFEKNADKTLPLASITKLMTSLLAYELLSDDTDAPLTARSLQQDGDSGLTEGEQISLKNLTRLALISSSNDAAFALAATVGESLGERDPAAQFVSGMNIRAQELGLETLDFKNPTGLDLSLTEPGAVGSAKDVTKLLEYILKHYPELVDSTQLSAARVYSTTGQYHDVENTNEALYAIPNLLASKTGYTDLAGGNLTVAFDVGYNHPIIVTVLGSSREGRFSDVLNLVNAVRIELKE
jgi:serine-type D-Ala-D-Ala carboxypeptidase (penicillin-binding protein 5/6)